MLRASKLQSHVKKVENVGNFKVTKSCKSGQICWELQSYKVMLKKSKMLGTSKLQSHAKKIENVGNFKFTKSCKKGRKCWELWMLKGLI